MNKLKYKRIGSFVLDLFIIFSLTFLISLVLPSNEDSVTRINNEVNELNVSYLNQKINSNEFTLEYTKLVHELERVNMPINIITILINFGYLIVITFIRNGQTFGQYIFKLKIKSDKDDITMVKLFLRMFFLFGLFYMILSIILNYTLTGLPYFIAMLVTMGIQLTILIMILVKFTKEKKGLHDKISKTSVVEIEEVTK